MKNIIDEKTATNIAYDFMNEMNPDSWNGMHDKPESVKTQIFEPDTKFNINGKECHLKILINTDLKQSYNDKPNLFVDLVCGSESLNMYKTSTLNAPAILSKMIMKVCNDMAA